MQTMEAAQQASALLRAYGPRAEAIVAWKIRACTEDGRSNDAGDWEQVRRSIREQRG